MNSVTSIKYC